jgi:hypothetical protein
MHTLFPDGFIITHQSAGFRIVVCCQLQVCIDLFVLSQAYTDIATLSTLSHTTGGSLYHYCPFTPLMDQDQLLNDLKWNVSRPQVGPPGSPWFCSRTRPAQQQCFICMT